MADTGFVLPVLLDLEGDLVGAALVRPDRETLQEVKQLMSLEVGTAEVSIEYGGQIAFVPYGQIEDEDLLDRIDAASDERGFVRVDDVDVIEIPDNRSPGYPAGLLNVGRVRALKLHCRNGFVWWSGVAAPSDRDDDVRVYTGDIHVIDLIGAGLRE